MELSKVSKSCKIAVICNQSYIRRFIKDQCNFSRRRFYRSLPMWRKTSRETCRLFWDIFVVFAQNGLLALVQRSLRGCVSQRSAVAFDFTPMWHWVYDSFCVFPLPSPFYIATGGNLGLLLNFVMNLNKFDIEKSFSFYSCFDSLVCVAIDSTFASRDWSVGLLVSSLFLLHFLSVRVKYSPVFCWNLFDNQQRGVWHWLIVTGSERPLDVSSCGCLADYCVAALKIKSPTLYV